MNKEQLLFEISQSVRSGVLTKEEIANVCDMNVQGIDHSKNPESQIFEGKKSFSASNILYLIGGLVLLIGIGTLLFRFWDDLSSSLRIVITLGIGIAAYISGLLLRTNNESNGVAVVMQVVGAFLLPIGIFVTINEMGVQDIGIGWIASVSTFLAIVYIVSLSLFRSIVFSFFSIAFGTWALYALVVYFLSQSAGIVISDVYEYLTLAVGVGYLLLSSYVKRTSHKALSNTLDSFGSLAIFGSILFLSGYTPYQSFFWEIVGILCIIGGLYMSSKLHNKMILKTTALAIFVFIGKFTGEYFVNSFGWPIALIVGGLIIIGAGFALVRFGKTVKA